MKKNIGDKGLLHSIGILASGTVIAQVIGICIFPLLTRFYSPEDFGILAVYASVLAIFAIIVTLRYQLAIPIAEKDDDALCLVLLCLIINIIITTICTIFIYSYGSNILILLGASNLSPYIWLIPLGMFFSGVYQTLNYWAIRVGDFKNIARSKVWQVSVMGAVQLFGYKFGIASLIVGQAIGQSAGSTTLAKSIYKFKKKDILSHDKLKEQAVKYRRYPLFDTWAALANTCGSQLPPLLFTAFFGPAVGGYYLLAHRMVSTPITVIGQAVGDVFISQAAEAWRNNELNILFEKIVNKLIMISMPLVIFLMIASPVLFETIFGESWQEAGEYARYLAIWLGMVLVCSPLSTLYLVLEKQKQGMIFQFSMTIVRIFVVCYGFYIGDIILTIILFSAIGGLFWFGFLNWAAIQAKSNSGFILSCFFKSGIYGILLCFPVLIGTILGLNSLSWWILAVISTVLILVYYFFQLKNLGGHHEY